MKDTQKKAKITFAGGVGGPTGSNFLFEADGKKILIDCGLEQGSKMAEDNNREPFIYDPASVDVLFVTHAHLDHLGRIPFLVKNGFAGRIISSPPTQELADPMYEDSITLLSHEAEREGKEPLYGLNDVKRALSLWESVEYGKEFKISDEITVVFHDAGHILGSTMVEMRYGKKKIMFTGDLGNSPSLLIRDTEKVSGINYMVMESVYGDRIHTDRIRREEILRETVVDTVKRKGVLMIPLFSLERTQDILFEMNDLVEHNKIPQIPVFLDSPLAIKITEVYRKNERYFNENAKEIMRADNIFKFSKLKFTPTVEDSKSIRGVPPPKVVMAGSGMSNGGRILFHERDYLSDPKNTLLLVGYQAVGTPGRLLSEGCKSIKILGEDVAVRANVAMIEGYSAHKDMNGLVDFVYEMQNSLEKVFVVMGEPKASTFLAQRLHDYIGVQTTIPQQGDTVELEF